MIKIIIIDAALDALKVSVALGLLLAPLYALVIVFLEHGAIVGLASFPLFALCYTAPANAVHHLILKKKKDDDGKK